MSPELGAAVIGLLVAVTGWIKNHSEVVSINQDRETVKANRDADSQKLHDDVLRLQCTQSTHADNIKVLFEQSVAANASIGSLTTQVDNLKKTVSEYKAQSEAANYKYEAFLNDIQRLDANGDNKIDATDASMLLSIYAYNSTNKTPVTTISDYYKKTS